MLEQSLADKMNHLHLWRVADVRRFADFWEIVGNSIVSTCLSLDYIGISDADSLLLYILETKDNANEIPLHSESL